jgi:hypothetical protein
MMENFGANYLDWHVSERIGGIRLRVRPVLSTEREA